MKNKWIYIIILLFCIGLSAYTQDGGTSAGSAPDANVNIMLARSSADYRVTPGDVYTLSYAAGSTPVTYIISVDTSYRIRVSNLGVVNGAGKTFIQLKNEVETIVTNNYPLSGVQMVLTQPAVFTVYIRGEVLNAREINAWGLTRLSSITNATATTTTTIANRTTTTTASTYLTLFSSIRDISIRSSNGQTRVYDLFKAQRLGDISQDPYLRPGDVITFNRVKRTVSILGAVERPGRYQLMDGEHINELISFYASGFTGTADSTRIEMVRSENSAGASGDMIFLTENDLAQNFKLEINDSITVPEITQLRPVMFIEGAIRTNFTEEAEILTSSTRIIVRYNNGETYAALVRRNSRWFTENSDTTNAYIIRKEEHIPINLNLALYDYSNRGDLLVQENDLLVVPFRQYFISVAGAVENPGRYPYIPDRDWEYYIGLAGGFIPVRNSRDVVTIVDINGKKLNKTDIITPETTITANTNHFLYYFNLYAPIVTTILSIVTSFFSVLTYATR